MLLASIHALGNAEATFLALAALAALALGAAPAPADGGSPADTPVGRWEDLGVPVRRSQVYSQALGKGPAGREILTLGMRDPVETFVLALDPHTGRGRQIPLAGQGGQVWSICAHSNGRAYATTGPGAAEAGALFEVDLGNSPARRLGGPPAGENVVWELVEGADGSLYGGTYPGAKLVRLTPATGAIEDLGRMDPDEMYVRSVATAGEYVYAGCGPKRPAVWAYHLPTGRKTQILPEAARAAADWGRPYRAADGCLYATGAGGRAYRVEGTAVTEVAKPPRPAPLLLGDGTRVDVKEESGTDQIYWLVGSKGERRAVSFTYACGGTDLFAVFNGPDGRIYGTTRTPITLFAFDPATGKAEVYGNPVRHAGQVYAWIWHQGRLHMTAYSRCTYSVWDPSRPWRFGAQPEDNPRVLGSVSRSIQRAGSMVLLPDGKRILVGGLPSYGRVGGGLALVDPEAPTFEVVERPVGEQSPWAIATTTDPDVVLLGTDMAGGSGTQGAVRSSPARLVFWNWRERRPIHELVPWEDEPGISSILRLEGQVLVCGRESGRLAVLDLASRTIAHRFAGGCDARGARLARRPADGKVYASAGGKLFRIDPAARRCEALGSYPGLGEFLAFDKEHVYGVAGTHLVRWRE